MGLSSPAMTMERLRLRRLTHHPCFEAARRHIGSLVVICRKNRRRIAVIALGILLLQAITRKDGPFHLLDGRLAIGDMLLKFPDACPSLRPVILVLLGAC